MPISSVSTFPAPPSAWKDVARLCRRICVLRERGERVEAARIESEQLPEILASLRAAGETDDTIQQRLTSLFAIEEERVADASVLAELLLPALRGEVTAQVIPAAAGSAQLEIPAVASQPSPVAATPPAPRKRSTDIATFIDEMLAQESAPARRAS